MMNPLYYGLVGGGRGDAVRSDTEADLCVSQPWCKVTCVMMYVWTPRLFCPVHRLGMTANVSERIAAFGAESRRKQCEPSRQKRLGIGPVMPLEADDDRIDTVTPKLLARFRQLFRPPLFEPISGTKDKVQPFPGTAATCQQTTRWRIEGTRATLADDGIRRHRLRPRNTRLRHRPDVSPCADRCIGD